jgi:pheromone shutdown protein TraB
VSEESARDVDLVIDAVKPDAVIVELCKGRSAVMYQDQGDARQRKKTAQPLSMTGALPVA